MKEVTKVPKEKIIIPYNEETKHIYETFALVARNIMQRRADAEKEATNAAD